MKISWDEDVTGTRHCSMEIDQEYIDKMLEEINSRAIDKVESIGLEDIRDALLNHRCKLDSLRFNEYDNWADAIHDYIYYDACNHDWCQKFDYWVDEFTWIDAE